MTRKAIFRAFKIDQSIRPNLHGVVAPLLGSSAAVFNETRTYHTSALQQGLLATRKDAANKETSYA